MDEFGAGICAVDEPETGFIGSNGLNPKLAAKRGIEAFHFSPYSCFVNIQMFVDSILEKNSFEIAMTYYVPGIDAKRFHQRTFAG